eukprot:TRINITY_DN7570_c0_g1_i4.p1 TRINITY_DN7570_c0_g1~~TRINITY_DN7570_c0_g1_i4.p1  ORF type:complete len:140 (+),score=14.47 TRINITY_DN7570_c0_g1_i4:289-708(+)
MASIGTIAPTGSAMDGASETASAGIKGIAFTRRYIVISGESSSDRDTVKMTMLVTIACPEAGGSLRRRHVVATLPVAALQYGIHHISVPMVEEATEKKVGHMNVEMVFEPLVLPVRPLDLSDSRSDCSNESEAGLLDNL